MRTFDEDSGVTLFWGIVIVLVFGTGFYFNYINNKDKNTSKNQLDSLKQVINQKDSLIAKEQARIDILVKSDSIRIYSINNSLKTIRNEIKNNSESIWVTPDSIHWLQVDSLRTRYGFHQIQRKRK